jgi:hypothetical protein
MPEEERLEPTRFALHRVCAHVLARRRYQMSGRFGLRAGTAGIVTPAFGEGPEVLRLTAADLVRERGGEADRRPLGGASLRQLAAFAGTDLDAPFSAGAATPPLGDPDAPLDLDPAASAALIGWVGRAWPVLDALTAGLATGTRASTIQLWPEHFDAAATLSGDGGTSVNLGFSAGDAAVATPYLYVGPVDDARPGDPEFWNAAFGATRTRAEVLAGDDPEGSCLAFFGEGLRRLGLAPPT